MTKELQKLNFYRPIALFKLIVLVSVVAFLGGCAGGVQMLPTLSQKNNIQPQQGIVVARFINASSYPIPFNYLTISPKNLNESEKIKPLRLTSLESVITESTIFAAPVTAGSYSLDSLYSYYTRGDYWYSRWAMTDASFGTFEVKKGQVTDLGTIIYYPKPQEGKYTNEFSRILSDSPAKTLTQFFPFQTIETDKVLGWNDEGLDEELQEKFISFAQNPVTYKETYKGPNEDVYFFGKLGVIIKRQADGEWMLDAVDAVVDMKTMVESEQGHLLIGGNEGKIFMKQPGSEEWTDVALKHGLNVDQLYIYNGVYVDALTRSHKTVEVYRGNLLDPDFKWNLMASYDRSGSWKNPQGNLQKNFIKSRKEPAKPSKKLFTSVSFDDPESPGRLNVESAVRSTEQVFGNTTTNSFAVDLNTWDARKVSNDTEFSRIRNAGFTKVGVKETGFWSFSSVPDYFVYDTEKSDWVKMSTYVVSCQPEFKSVKNKGCVPREGDPDEGAKYEKPKLSTFSFVSLPWFKTAEDATAIASVDGRRVVLQTKSKGKFWEIADGSLPNDYCSILVGDISENLILSCSGATGDFYESEDMGISWQLVREHQDF